jgi:general secretion pathway protein D
MGTDYEVTLRAIAAAGKTEVLSRPSILARNNQQASIVIGQEIPFITDSQITDNGNTINTIQYDEIGIILRVTPFITSDGLVEMIVSPEISNLTDETVPVSTGVSAPVIAKRSADTVVVTPNGQTIIIGGLMEKNKTEAESKIPFLGDIPLLGALFKRTISDESKTELLIFLTPYIVNRPSELAAMTEDERSKTELVPKAFTEEDLNRFLDDVITPEEPDKKSSRKRK